ncbi:MAG: hypothetical protein AAGD11_10075 [Planctomycetota bacterium]
MKHRVTSASGNAVSLFPFLAVLLCTMGALLVLLVVLSQRAGERALAEAEQEEPTAVENAVFEQPTAEDSEAVAELVARLAEAEQAQEKLAERRSQADKRLRDEQAKLTHLEEHTRRLEHELARMSVAAEQLTAAENKQTVDQQQAENELQRLQSLVAEKTKAVEELQEANKGKRSYAIVPFIGKDGSVAPRIYIECSSAGVIIQPEGTGFELTDFLAGDWPGNPLAKVVRATQQHLQSKAQQAGQPTTEPLPLLIVRPDGIRALDLARKALEAAEISFGFDYVGGEQAITYPVAVDPLLARTQHQALTNARHQYASHIAAAPRKYRPKLERHGVTVTDLRAGRPGRGATFGAVRSSRRGSSTLGDANSTGSGEVQFGAMQNESGSPSTTLGTVTEAEARSGVRGTASEGDNVSDARGAVGEMAQSGGQAGPDEFVIQQQIAGAGSAASPEGLTDPHGSGNDSLAAGVITAGPAEANRMISAKQDLPQEHSNRVGSPRRKSRNAVPLQRPIQVAVRKDHFALLPSRHGVSGDADGGVVISMNQSAKQIGEKLKVGLLERIDEWGIAGHGLYWKPVLNLKVGPDGAETARRLAKMLANSGLEVRLPKELRVGRGEQTNAIR